MVALTLTPEGRLIFAGRALRSFSFGWLSVILALYLHDRGLSAAAIGAAFTATMVERIQIKGSTFSRKRMFSRCSARL